MFEDIRLKTVAINLKMRQFALENSVYPYEITDIPFGGNIRDSIGPFPEYILHGVKCSRFESGLCSPCGYSLDGYSARTINEKFRNLIDTQVNEQCNFLIENYESAIQKKQYRVFENREYRTYLALGSVGSFFCDLEIKFKTKKSFLERLVEIQKRNKPNLYIFTEVRPEDVFLYERTGKLEEISGLLNSLNTTVLLGFESVNEISRNCSYLKGLSLRTFENAVKILRGHGLMVGAFVFVGSTSSTQEELVNDFSATIDFLYKNKIMPVIMVEDIKICTLNHLLFQFGTHKLVEPITTARILEILRKKEIPLDPDPWLISDPVGGPPEPLIHSFHNSKMMTCKGCAEKILNELRHLRETYSWKNFEKINDWQRCDCYRLYEELIDSEKVIQEIALEQRIKNDLEFAEKNLERYLNYLSTMKNTERSIVQ